MNMNNWTWTWTSSSSSSSSSAAWIWCVCFVLWSVPPKLCSSMLVVRQQKQEFCRPPCHTFNCFAFFYGLVDFQTSASMILVFLGGATFRSECFYKCGCFMGNSNIWEIAYLRFLNIFMWLTALAGSKNFIWNLFLLCIILE